MSNYNPNDLFANRYLLLEKIGIGGFSEVWKAEDQMAEDAVVAIKIYAPERGMDELGLKQFRREYAVVLNLNHPSLLTARHFDVFNGSPYLVMPFISGGSVYNQLMEHGNYSEEQMAKLIAQMGDAFHFLHDNEVLHQDIKPDNILIDNRGNYLLTDFGISSRLRSSLRKSTTTNKAMTVAYAPPERFHGTQEALAAGDIFSFGVLLYELSVGDVPWMGAGGVVVRADSNPIELPDEYSKRFQHLVQACLRFNPSDRPTAADLKNWALEFMREGAWPEIPQVSAAPKEEVKEPARGRSTQRMDDIPAEDLQPKSAAPSGKEAATMKHGDLPLNNETKKGNKKGIVIGAVAVIAVALAVVFLMNKGTDPSAAIEVKDAKTQAYDSLMRAGDSIYGVPDFMAAKSVYEQALALIPGDSSAIAALSLCEKGMDEMVSLDTTAVENPEIVSTEEPVKTPVVDPTPAPKPKPKPEPTPTPKKPVADEYEGSLYNQTSLGETYDYSGTIKNGKPHGYGVATFESGDVYKGNWENGVRTGSGNYTFSDGTTYVGGWKNDRFSGRGKMTWDNGDSYDGSYSNGMRNGLGTYTTGGNDINYCPDCRKYQGYWKDNGKHGTGKCFDRKGGLLYEGDFRDGRPVDDYPNR